MREIFVGTSGYASPNARFGMEASSGAAPDLLAAYAERFGAVELDSCFYRPPALDTVRSWCDVTPDHFRFVVRVPRDITHADRLADPGAVARFVESLAPLGDRLNALLFTLPADLDCQPGLLVRVLEALPAGLRSAWEFRDTSWFCHETFELLCAHDATPVVVQARDGTHGEDLLPGGTVACRWELPFLYVRFRKDGYRPGELMAWSEIVAEGVDDGIDLYSFFRQSPESLAYATAFAELMTEVAAEHEPQHS